MNRQEVLAYLLRDILEIQYSQNRNENNKIISLLLKNKAGDKNIYPIHSFMLYDNLIAIKNDKDINSKVKNIFLLDGQTKENLVLRNITRHRTKAMLRQKCTIKHIFASMFKMISKDTMYRKIYCYPVKLTRVHADIYNAI